MGKARLTGLMLLNKHYKDIILNADDINKIGIEKKQF